MPVADELRLIINHKKYVVKCNCYAAVQIRVTVLYINPTTKVLSLSELTHLVTPDLAPIELFGSVKVGAIVDKAVVARVDPRRGVYFRLSDKLKAFASVCMQLCIVTQLSSVILSAQCISSIGQIIKSVCVSVSQ